MASPSATKARKHAVIRNHAGLRRQIMEMIIAEKQRLLVSRANVAKQIKAHDDEENRRTWPYGHPRCLREKVFCDIEHGAPTRRRWLLGRLRPYLYGRAVPRVGLPVHGRAVDFVRTMPA